MIQDRCFIFSFHILLRTCTVSKFSDNFLVLEKVHLLYSRGLALYHCIQSASPVQWLSVYTRLEGGDQKSIFLSLLVDPDMSPLSNRPQPLPRDQTIEVL